MDKKQDAEIEINYPKLETDMPGTGVYMTPEGGIYCGQSAPIFRGLDARFHKYKQQLERRQARRWNIISAAYGLLTFIALAPWAIFLSWRERGLLAIGGEWLLVAGISGLVGWLVHKLGNMEA
ncbi:MAG: hypothetical protein ACOX3P_03770 [Saccharofermentanales bacterium]|jgi:hypothetical protein|nr:hypothetical protein [Clostridiales bacterium]